MTKKFFVKLLGLGLLLSAGHASALSTYGLSSGGAGDVGDTVTLDLVYDNGGPGGTLLIGGGFVITYDEAVLDFVSLDYTLTDLFGLPCDNPTSQCIVLDPPVLAPGEIQGAAGDFSGIGLFGVPVMIAQVTFEVIAAGGETEVGFMLGGAGGPTVCAPTCDDLVVNGTTVTTPDAVIPLPAAAWFLLGGLGSLLGFRRRS